MSEVARNPLSAEEMLARFIMRKDWIRRADNTVKQDAFIPPTDLQLSVTRHCGISTDQLNQFGKAVANQRALEFHGRADIETKDVITNGVKAVAWPLDDNKNHAHIIGWPVDKENRKTIAQELAAASKFVPS